MEIAAIFVSLSALFISALSYYRSHHYISRKLFIFPTLTINTFKDFEIPLTIINGGSNDVVLIGCSLSRKVGEKNGLLTNQGDMVIFQGNFDGLLNPGNAAIAVLKFDGNFDKTDLHNCGNKIEFVMSVSWCDSLGKNHRALVDVFYVQIDSEANIKGYGQPELDEKNLYKRIVK